MVDPSVLANNELLYLKVVKEHASLEPIVTSLLKL